MKIKKILISLCLLSNLFLFFKSEAITSFQVKRVSDVSYSSSLTDLTNGEQISFRVVRTDASNLSKPFQISMPTWMVYNSYTKNDNCTNFSLNTNSNTSFNYSYSWTAVCSVTFNYTLSWVTSWSKQINLVYDSWIIWSVSFNVTSNNTITKAQTKDLNNNWYIDAYLVTFANNILDLNDYSLLKIWLEDVNSYSWTTSSWYLLFDDNIFHSWETPQIISSWVSFWNIWQISNSSIIEEDTSKPVLLKVDWQSILSNSSVSVWSWVISFEFSENLSPWSWSWFSIPWVSWNFSLNEKILTFTPSSSISAWNYSLSVDGNLAKDLANNKNWVSQINISLIVWDTQSPAWTSIWSWTWIIINNWSSTTNNRYVQLSLSASDNVWVDKMWISNSSTFASWDFENYSTSKNNWDLWSTNWTKIVYVKFKDVAWNISPTYSASISLNIDSNSYLTITTPSSLYTNNNNITLSWSCNYVTSTWSIISSTLNYSVNDAWNGTTNCNSWNKSWSNNFSLQTNTSNVIKIWFWSDYDSATTKNSITIVNPDVVCSTWYTKVWNTCVANSCNSETKTVNWKTYSVSSMFNSTSWSFTSNSVSITWWTITYNQSFSCSLWTISTSWSEVANTPSCNSWYSVSWSSCVPSSCSAQSITISWKTYSVPSLSHSSSTNVTSNSVSITWWTITYTQWFTCSFWNISTSGWETTNSPTCDTWYAINWSSCSLLSDLSCSSSYSTWSLVFPSWTIAHLWTWTRTSSPVAITNWTITYNQQFSCSLTILTPVWSPTANSPTCSSWYSINWSSCEPSNCTAQNITINSNTYQVPALNHNSTWSINSSLVNITWWTATFKQIFKCELWQITQVWSEEQNTPTCSSSYIVSWNSCILRFVSGWWWGWWYTPPPQTTKTCTNDDLVCNSSWIYSQKSWVNCSWWNLWKQCSTSNNQSETFEDYIEKLQIWEDFKNYIETKTWENINKESLNSEIVINYLKESSNKWLQKTILEVWKKTNIKNINILAKYDKTLEENYYKLLINYKNTFENIDLYLENKDKNTLKKAANNYKEFSKIYSQIKAPEEKYISKESLKNNIVYSPIDKNLAKKTDVLEKVFISKFDSLLAKKIINKEKYESFINNYNDFILHFTLFKKYKDNEVKNLSKKYLEQILKDYKTKK